MRFTDPITDLFQNVKKEATAKGIKPPQKQQPAPAKKKQRFSGEFEIDGQKYRLEWDGDGSDEEVAKIVNGVKAEVAYRNPNNTSDRFLPAAGNAKPTSGGVPMPAPKKAPKPAEETILERAVGAVGQKLNETGVAKPAPQTKGVMPFEKPNPEQVLAFANQYARTGGKPWSDKSLVPLTVNVGGQKITRYMTPEDAAKVKAYAERPVENRTGREGMTQIVANANRMSDELRNSFTDSKVVDFFSELERWASPLTAGAMGASGAVADAATNAYRKQFKKGAAGTVASMAASILTAPIEAVADAVFAISPESTGEEKLRAVFNVLANSGALEAGGALAVGKLAGKGVKATLGARAAKAATDTAEKVAKPKGKFQEFVDDLLGKYDEEFIAPESPRATFKDKARDFVDDLLGRGVDELSGDVTPPVRGASILDEALASPTAKPTQGIREFRSYSEFTAAQDAGQLKPGDLLRFPEDDRIWTINENGTPTVSEPLKPTVKPETPTPAKVAETVATPPASVLDEALAPTKAEMPPATAPLPENAATVTIPVTEHGMIPPNARKTWKPLGVFRDELGEDVGTLIKNEQTGKFYVARRRSSGAGLDSTATEIPREDIIHVREVAGLHEYQRKTNPDYKQDIPESVGAVEGQRQSEGLGGSMGVVSAAGDNPGTREAVGTGTRENAATKALQVDTPENVGASQVQTATVSPDAPSTPTSARQADINADREALGKAGFSTDDVRKWEQLEKNADPALAPKDAEKPWSDQDTVNAVAKLRDLKAKIETERAAVKARGEKTSELLVSLEDEFDDLTENMYRAGTEQGRALASRRYTMDMDMSADAMRARYKARAAKNGTKVDAKRLKELEDIAAEYEKLKQTVDKSTARRAPIDLDMLTPDDPRLDPMHYDGLTDTSMYDVEYMNRVYVELFGDLPGDMPAEVRSQRIREALRDRINRAIEEEIRVSNLELTRDVRDWFRQAGGGKAMESRTGSGPAEGWNVAVPGRYPGDWVAGAKVRMVSTEEIPPEYLQIFMDWLPSRVKGAEKYIRGGGKRDFGNASMFGEDASSAADRGLGARVADFDELMDIEGGHGLIPQSVVDEFVRDLSRQIGEDMGKVPVTRKRRVHIDSEFDDLISQYKQVALSSMNTGINPELVPIIGKIVANRIRYGVASVEELIEAVQKKFRERLLDPPDRQTIIDAYAQYKAEQKAEPKKELIEARQRKARIERELREESTQRKEKYVADAESKAEAAARRAVERAEERARKAAERLQTLEANRKAKADAKSRARAEKAAADAEAKALREEQERILSERSGWDKRNKERQQTLDRLNTRIAELEQSIDAGTGEGPKKRATKKEDVDIERARAKMTMLQSRARAIYASTQPKGVADKAVGLLNVPRTVKASIDISAPGRQGWILGIGNPKAAGKAFADQMRALSTEEGAVMAQNAIMNRPNAPKYKAADLYLAPVDGSLNAKEEAFLGSEMFSRWKKFNPVRASDRAYAAYLNRLRADVFDNMANALGPDATDEQLREIARYINVASGRGDIGGKGSSEIGKSIGRSMPAAAMFFWSPRNVISRIQFATGVPIAQAIKVPGARRLIAKEYAKSIIATGSVIGLAKLALEKSGEGGVSGDISSSDFGKIRVGDTRVDIMAGVQQPLVLIGRLMTGKSTSPVSGKVTDLKSPKFGQPGPGDMVMRFAKSKANPIFGSAEELYTGKDFVGQPVGTGEALANVIAPLSVKEIYEALTEEGVDREDALVLLNIFGISTARFKGKEKAQP